jgi:hypothetical protein
MSSMKPGTAYSPTGSINATPHGQPMPGKNTVGNANAKGALPKQLGGGGKRMTSEGPLKPQMAKKAPQSKNGKGR